MYSLNTVVVFTDDLVVDSQNSVRLEVQTGKKDQADNLQSDPCQESSSSQQIDGRLPHDVLMEDPVVEGGKEKSFKTERERKGQNREKKTRMKDVKDGLRVSCSFKGKRIGKAKLKQRIAEVGMESNGLLGKSGELSKSSTTLINHEEEPSNEIVEEKEESTNEGGLGITEDVECEPLVIDLSHLELPVVDYVEQFGLYKNGQNFESFFEDDDAPDEAIITQEKTEN
ncbi:hypothetical protein SUGI_0923520 [Cryptomeria japonica]|nr:hypothetical protein SUGI_0923520 [Cryptomeria japonica]